ncbi:MAG: NAD(P)H-dependent oxidoreductase subunit E [Clostridia bacterium]|nr:NAD(P)H-dependent oxidoreductase subunit E [Clostridia bacterium]
MLNKYGYFHINAINNFAGSTLKNDGGSVNVQKKISNHPFNGTPEQAAKLEAVINANKHDKSLLMAVMQEAQGIYGYLPYEVQKMIADGMDIPIEKVFGVSTFYAQFSLTPKGEYNISVCLGTACYVKGAGIIFDKLSEKLGIGAEECTADGKFSLTACRCIGACGLAPVLTVNEEVYGRLEAKDVDTILAKYQ